MVDVEEWQALVNKPVLSSDGKDIGVVKEIQPQRFVVSYGPITPDLYAIPKSLIHEFRDGVVYLSKSGDFVEDNYKFE